MTQQELEDSILIIASKYNVKDNYEAMLQNKIGLLSTVEQLIRLMFVKRFNIEDPLFSDEIKAYWNIWYYYEEIYEKGFFKFE